MEPQASPPNLRSLNIDEPFVRQSSSNEFYHTDALGSTLALSNTAGAVATSYNYEAFGKTTVTGVSLNTVQYTGRENDGTGLYYYRARYYSPKLQRFLSEDPLQFNGGDINLFAYVLNSPVNLADPFGTKVIYMGKPPTDPNTIAKLEALDRVVGDRDVIVTKRGGSRTQEEQAKINPNAPDSLHVKGKAADVVVPGLTSEQVAEKAAPVKPK